MSEDWFKPLYKAHKRAAIADLQDVFDPHRVHTEVRVGDYALKRIDAHTWECDTLPGLSIKINTLSHAQQSQLIKESVADYLQSPEHLTNLDAHYKISRPISFFNGPRDAEASTIKIKNKSEFVRDKMRWVTLGGQYNWTTKVYPSFQPGTPDCPYFPESLSKKIALDLGINPEAAIVNYYSEGDILSPHQDVAELASQDLISISLGCACVFYLGASRFGVKPLPLLLRSGDIVIMGGSSRFAFHGVGRVFGESTPSELCQNTEISDPAFANWIRNHRVNINIRQMQSEN